MMVGRQLNLCDRVKGGGCPLCGLGRVGDHLIADLPLDVACHLNRVKGFGHRRGVLLPEHERAVLVQGGIHVRFRIPHQLAHDVIVHVLREAMMIPLDVVPWELPGGIRKIVEIVAHDAVDADAKAAVAKRTSVSPRSQVQTAAG